MLKRLTGGLEEVHSTAGPILTAMQEIASASTLAAIIEILRKHLLDEAIDRVGILQLGAATDGDAIVEHESIVRGAADFANEQQVTRDEQLVH